MAFCVSKVRTESAARLGILFVAHERVLTGHVFPNAIQRVPQRDNWIVSDYLSNIRGHTNLLTVRLDRTVIVLYGRGLFIRPQCPSVCVFVFRLKCPPSQWDTVFSPKSRRQVAGAGGEDKGPDERDEGKLHECRAKGYGNGSVDVVKIGRRYYLMDRTRKAETCRDRNHVRGIAFPI
ncbi:uncharacterized protein LOC126266267 [Aethina tumida]|uniref:uncharacterized protein LOC126266267 n=1 Tax=Aethina tumida TaxID=116153 RepID=UPI002148AD4C|nr:uncharacterized protein LOC126266267 [Aethina tumida]